MSAFDNPSAQKSLCTALIHLVLLLLWAGNYKAPNLCVELRFLFELASTPRTHFSS